MIWASVGSVECCFLQVRVSEIAGSRRVHRGGAANRWAECQEFVIRTGRAAYLCWRREGVLVFSHRAASMSWRRECVCVVQVAPRALVAPRAVAIVVFLKS